MPELCRFYGIIIQIHFREHPPAHFHALYGDNQAVIGIETLEVLKGFLPTKEQRLVLRWASLHQAELRVAWERAQDLEDPGKIAPLK